jgi:hypothetical protein
MGCKMQELQQQQISKVLASGDFCFLEFIFPKLNSAPVAS